MERRTFIVAALLLGIAACDHGPSAPESSESGAGTLGFVVSAVTDNCSGNPGADPTQEMNWLLADVYGRDSETGDRILVAQEDCPITPGLNTCLVSNVGAGTGYEVKLRGYLGSDFEQNPKWFGQRRNLSVVQDQDNAIEMVLSRFGAFTCLSPPTSFTQRIFPSVVQLSDGRILISGGFTRATVDPLSASQITLESASNVAIIYDPFTGEIVQTQNTMTEVRAGHTAVFVPLPDSEKVLIFGGTKKMTMRLDGTFPFSIDSADSLNSYEVFDLKTLTFSPAGEDQEGNPKQMLLKRAFPTAVRLFDNSVLIGGGGEWPKDIDDYRRAEIWLPEEDGGNGGIQDLGAASPWMMSQHNAAAVTKLEDTTTGLSRYLFLGGTDETENLLEVYTQSSRQKEGVSGTFVNLEVAGLTPSYFSTLTPMTPLTPTTQKQFLALGGVKTSGGDFAPMDTAYLVMVDPGSQPKVTIDTIANPACTGRFFHSVNPTFVRGKAIVLGGFADFQGTAGSETCMFEVTDGQGMFHKLSGGFEAFVPRAGHRTQLLPDDTLLVVGGMVSSSTLSGDTAGMMEIYTHPWIDLN